MVWAVVVLPVLTVVGDILTGQAIQGVVAVVLIAWAAGAGVDVTGGIVFVDALVDDQAGFIFQVLMNEPSLLVVGSGLAQPVAEHRGGDLPVDAVFDLAQNRLHLPCDLGRDFGDPAEYIALVLDAST